MPAFTEVLPPSRSNPHRALRYTPACRGVGVVELADRKTFTRYAVAVQPFGGVRFTKADGETYVATTDACDCAGWTYGKGRPCKHTLAVAALVENDWLEHDGRETVTDADAEIEAKDAYYTARGI